MTTATWQPACFAAPELEQWRAGCATCIHAIVCGLRDRLEGLKAVEVVLPKLPAVQGVQVAVTASCEHHEPAKGSRRRQGAAQAGQRRPRTHLTPEQVADARRRVDAGESVQRVADDLGVHHTTLRERLASHGRSA